MTLTKIQTALYDLWFKYYTRNLTDEQRSNYVQSFIDENLQGYDISTLRAKHPAHYKRESDSKHRLYPIVEILGDFIIRAEEDVTKLTTSAQTSVNHENRRNEREVLTDFTDNYNDEEDAANVKVGTYTEYDVYKQSSTDLYIDFTEISGEYLSMDQFKTMIKQLQTDSKEYAGVYSRKYDKDYDKTLRSIRRLDVNRVAICEECGEVYYRHDLRRKYCDLRPSCKVNAKRRRESERYYNKVSKKVEDRADVLHYVIEGKKSDKEVLSRDTSIIF